VSRGFKNTETEHSSKAAAFYQFGRSQTLAGQGQQPLYLTCDDSLTATPHPPHHHLIIVEYTAYLLGPNVFPHVFLYQRDQPKHIQQGGMPIFSFKCRYLWLNVLWLFLCNTTIYFMKLAVRDFLLFFWTGEAKRIRGPMCGMVSVHGSFNT
jgi:hypothetical protein